MWRCVVGVGWVRRGYCGEGGVWCDVSGVLGVMRRRRLFMMRMVMLVVYGSRVVVVIWW